MKKISWLLIYAFILLPFIGRSQNVSVDMSRLQCDKTTEPDGDEIYIQVIAKISNGSFLNIQEPNGQWTLRDNAEPRMIEKVPLLKTNLKAGESGTIVIIVAEQDGTQANQWKKLGEAMLASCDQPGCIASQQVLPWAQKLGLTVQDTDDYIGSFSLDFGYDDKGVFWWKRGNLEKYCAEEKWETVGTKIQLCGDNSSYTGWFYFGNGN